MQARYYLLLAALTITFPVRADHPGPTPGLVSHNHDVRGVDKNENTFSSGARDKSTTPNRVKSRYSARLVNTVQSIETAFLPTAE